MRTTQRDLLVLQSDLHVPLVKKGNDRYTIFKSYLLPPVSLSLYEALELFLASRLIIHQTDEGNPHLQMAITKLASILPQPLAAQLRQSVDSIREKRIDQENVNIFEQVAIAWSTQRRIRIVYHSLRSNQEKVWVVDPYFIEMTGVGYSAYVIGYAEGADRNGITTFKLNRIKEIELLEESFEIPEGLKLDELLGSSWGVVWGEDIVVKLKFSPSVTRRVKESNWHPSQIIEDLPDGGCTLTLRVGSFLEITPWIRSWGPDVEVLEPKPLRNDFQAWVNELHRMYGGNTE